MFLFSTDIGDCIRYHMTNTSPVLCCRMPIQTFSQHLVVRTPVVQCIIWTSINLFKQKQENHVIYYLYFIYCIKFKFVLYLILSIEYFLYVYSTHLFIIYTHLWPTVVHIFYLTDYTSQYNSSDVKYPTLVVCNNVNDLSYLIF